MLAEPDVGTVSHLFLVGGFAESPLLQVSMMMMLQESMMMMLQVSMMTMMMMVLTELDVGMVSHHTFSWLADLLSHRCCRWLP